MYRVELPPEILAQAEEIEAASGQECEAITVGLNLARYHGLLQRGHVVQLPGQEPFVVIPLQRATIH